MELLNAVSPPTAVTVRQQTPNGGTATTSVAQAAAQVLHGGGSTVHPSPESELLRDVLMSIQALRQSQIAVETHLTTLLTGQRRLHQGFAELVDNLPVKVPNAARLAGSGKYASESLQRASEISNSSRRRHSHEHKASTHSSKEAMDDAIEFEARLQACQGSSSATMLTAWPEEDYPEGGSSNDDRLNSRGRHRRKRATGPARLQAFQRIVCVGPTRHSDNLGCASTGQNSDHDSSTPMAPGSFPTISSPTASIASNATKENASYMKPLRRGRSEQLMAVAEAATTPSMSLLDRPMKELDVNHREEQPADLGNIAGSDHSHNPDEEGSISRSSDIQQSQRISGAESGNENLCQLGPSWPMSVPMRKQLEGNDEKVSGQLAALFTRSSQAMAMTMMTVEPSARERTFSVLDPDALPMMLLDLMSSIVLLHDLFVTPYVTVMDLELDGALKYMAIVAACFWTVDFLLGFTTGFYVKGELNSNRQAIVQHYLKTWCFPNMLILVFDWWSFFSDDQARSLKVVRLVKVFRLAKLIRLVDKMSAWCSLSQWSRTVLQVSKIVFGVLIYNHFVSCLWLYIGRRVDSDTGSGWLDYTGLENEPLRDQDLMYQYVTSFHWTLAQMTPGPIDIVASNTVEQITNSILLILGLLFGSLIVSLCSGQVMQLIMAQRDLTLTLEALERFLRQSSIGVTLAVRVKRQVMDRINEERLITENDVSALNLLSATLRSQVVCETRRPHLVSHALFRTWYQFDISTFNVLCEKAVGLQFLSVEDDLFLPEDEAPGAWFVIKGGLRYDQWPDTSKIMDFQSRDVVGGAWICEAGLWSHWTHVGRMEAITAAQLLFVSAERLMSVCEKKLLLSFMIKQYGRNFHLRIISSSPPFAPWPDDLHVSYTDMSDLVSKDVGIGLLKKAVRTGTLKMEDSQMKLLEEEVQQEKCALQEMPSGELQRIVAVVTLRLHRSSDSDLFLAVLGKWAPDHGLMAACELPGCKRSVGELPQRALQRVLEKHLFPFARAAQLSDITHENFTRMSPKYGLPTQYLKTTHVGALQRGASTVLLPGVRSKEGPDAPISARDIHFIRADDGVVLYTWLNLAEFTELSDDQGKLTRFLSDAEMELVLECWSGADQGANGDMSEVPSDIRYSDVFQV